MQLGAESTSDTSSVQITDAPSIYPGHRILAMFPFYNEESKIVNMALRLRHGLADKIVGVNDGSTDDGPGILRAHGIHVLDMQHTGAGACIRRAVEYGRANGFDILVVMAGNNKDNPEEIPRLLAPIIEGHADYVQGSRFMKGGLSSNLPLFRLVAIKFLSLVFSAYTWQWCTDLTNGFRAYRLTLFDDPRINIWQEWLNKYEYEFYVHLNVHRYGYKTAEVAVTKTYPGIKGVPYTKVKPFTGWWQMLRPFVLLTLHLKK